MQKNAQQPRKNHWLRQTLSRSRKDAVASSVMTGFCDNYLGAFAVYLRASVSQIGWLSAAPQLVGAIWQLLSAWLCPHFSRRRAIVSAALIQALAVFGMALIAITRAENAVTWLIALAICYHAAQNFVNPQWRSWMGSIVPVRRRGAFFAGRTRLTMITTLGVFAGAGLLLGWFESLDLSWLAFALLFLAAAAGRAMSAWQLRHMYDPDPATPPDQRASLVETLRTIRQAARNRTFREYSLFFAGMQFSVAISGPFFSVYMLRDLGYGYWAFSVNTGAAIITQFFTLHLWGLACDRWGNRLVMVISSCLIPVVPALWLFSENYVYLLVAQVVSGLAWGGFTLSTANYLYDIRPPRTDFAHYAALQSSLSALGVFAGALCGGYLATVLPDLNGLLPESWQLQHPIIVLFALSALIRAAFASWFIPRSRELRIRHHPSVLQVIYRISRFTPGAGVVLDWLTVTKQQSGRTSANNKPDHFED